MLTRTNGDYVKNGLNALIDAIADSGAQVTKSEECVIRVYDIESLYDVCGNEVKQGAYLMAELRVLVPLTVQSDD